MTMDDCYIPDAEKLNGHYDLAVIGAGSAGFSAAITAAELSARVALIGHGTIGGTCVNTGCVPSKNLIRATEALHHANVAARFAGIRAHGNIEDWRAVVRHKEELVSSLRRAKYIDLLPSYNTIAYLEGWAQLTNGGVAVDGNLLTAGKVIVATGASASLPPIPGIEGVPHLTSTTALELERLPRSLLVLGGGYTGCELGQMFARADVEVTIVDILPLLAAGEPEISQALALYLREEGIVVRENVETWSIHRTARGIALEIFAEGRDETLEAEQVLVATGRRPNTEGMGLKEAGVELLPHGGIKVDQYMRTTKPGAYAAGDVTRRDPFVYMAAYGAKLAAENALTSDRKRYDATTMPAIVFTDPQVATVGLTEAAARERPRGQELGAAARPGAAGAGGARYQGPDQAGRRYRHQQAPRRAYPGARRRRQHPDRRAGNQMRVHGRAIGRDDFPVSDHGRRAEARRPSLRQGRREALLLRRIARPASRRRGRPADAEDRVDEQRRPAPQRIDEDRGGADRHRHHRPDGVDEPGRRQRNADAVETEGERDVLYHLALAVAADVARERDQAQLLAKDDDVSSCAERPWESAVKPRRSVIRIAA